MKLVRQDLRFKLRKFDQNIKSGFGVCDLKQTPDGYPYLPYTSKVKTEIERLVSIVAEEVTDLETLERIMARWLDGQSI